MLVSISWPRALARVATTRASARCVPSNTHACVPSRRSAGWPDCIGSSKFTGPCHEIQGRASKRREKGPGDRMTGSREYTCQSEGQDERVCLPAAYPTLIGCIIRFNQLTFQSFRRDCVWAIGAVSSNSCTRLRHFSAKGFLHAPARMHAHVPA